MVIGASALFSLISKQFFKKYEGSSSEIGFLIFFSLMIIFPIKTINNFLYKKRSNKLLFYTKEPLTKLAVIYF